MHTTDIWPAALNELKLQMTQATFNTWLANTTATQTGDTITVTVANKYAKAKLKNRLDTTIRRTLARLTKQPINVRYTIAYPEGHETMHTTSTTRAMTDAGETPPDELDRDQPPECRFAVELVHFDPRELGHVRASNYAHHYWQPFIATVEREHRMRCTGVSFVLWLTLKSFPAHFATRTRPHWPSIQTLADIVANGNRHRILGRSERKGKTPRAAVVGALHILEQLRIVWLTSHGAGSRASYTFKVLDLLPLLTPTQAGRLSPRLQLRHAADIAKCQVNVQQWRQLTLPMLTQEETL